MSKSHMKMVSRDILPPRLIYLDVSDVINFLKDYNTVSGIQRVQIEVAAALHKKATDLTGVRVCVTDDTGEAFYAFPVEYILEAKALIETAESPREQLDALIEKIYDERQAVRFRRGDVCYVGGAFWLFESTPRKLFQLARSGVLVGFQCYDLIPIHHREYCSEALSTHFKRMMDAMIRCAHFSLTISVYVEQQLRAYARSQDITSLHVRPVLLAHDIAASAPDDVEDGHPAPAVAASGKAGDRFGLRGKPFVLFVSTIEPRKNHNYTFLLWQRLIAELGDDCPTLVWVGREGWLVGDLMERARRTDNLDGKLKIIHEVSDSDLVRLYRDCAFTIYPSLAEGYGLPVAESLIFGKPCIASSTTSIPEVGDDFVWYVDPYNITEGLELVRKLIADPSLVRAATARIRQDFRPRRWSQVAQEMLAAVEDYSRDFDGERIVSNLALREGKIYPVGRDEARERDFAPGELATLELMFDEHWYAREHWGRWIKGLRSGFSLYRADQTPGPHLVYLEVQALHKWGGRTFSVAIPELDYKRHFALEGGGVTSFYIEVDLPAEPVEITLNVAHLEKGGDTDERKLSIGLRAVGFARNDDPQARLALYEGALLSQRFNTLRTTAIEAKTAMDLQKAGDGSARAGIRSFVSHVQMRWREESPTKFMFRSVSYLAYRAGLWKGR